MRASTKSKEAVAEKKGRRVGKVITIILITVLIIALAWLGFYIYKLLNIETFYFGVVVDDISLEGMSKKEAIDKVRDKYQPTLDEVNIVLQIDDKKWSFDYEDIGASIDIEETIEEAYKIGREGSIIDRLREIRETAENGKTFKTTLTYDVELLKDSIEEIAKEVHIEPEDATITFNPNNKTKFSFTEEKSGRAMLVDETMAALKSKVNAWEFSPYDIPTEELKPKYTLKELKTWTSKIAEFSTKLSGSDERKYNIAFSAKSFKGARIDPGEVFSFNEITGPRDSSHGYKNAPVIKDGRVLVEEPGGGNCQTSSTLYGALIRADLEVVERYPHSWPSTYIEIGQDATVNYPNVDLKVKNNKDSAVFLDSYVSNGRIVVVVYGKAPEEYDKIEVVSSVLESKPAPAANIVKDSSLYEDQTVVEYKSRPGYKVQTYRVYYRDGKEVKRVKESLSSYPVVTGKKRVGTKKRPVATKPKKSTEKSEESSEKPKGSSEKPLEE